MRGRFTDIVPKTVYFASVKVLNNNYYIAQYQVDTYFT